MDATRADEHQQVIDILTALEYGEKKEETELLDAVLPDLGISRQSDKGILAGEILQGPGFETFLFEILKAVRPFALMLRDIYTFLNDQHATATRRASIFRVSSSGAEQQLDFDLDNFPKELLAVLTTVNLIGSSVELRFPDIPPGEEPFDWSNSATARAWEAASPRWDNDFYDDGFHRALSYAHTLIPPSDPGWQRLETLVEPLLDRLAAVVVYADSIQPLELRSASLTAAEGDGQFQPVLPVPRSHRVTPRSDPQVLLHRVTSWSRNEATVFDELRYLFYSSAVAIHLFRSETIRRQDRDDWLAKRLGLPFQRISANDYITYMEAIATEYREKLDDIAPVVDQFSETAIQEKLLEFLLLPFWKNRWFLYEIWTLALVLGAAADTGPLELLQLEEMGDGSVEWRLPGGTATHPVASVGTGGDTVLAWTQRKTYHPGTGEGLEPDLRLTSATPGYHDLVIIENKDRRKPAGPEIAEIARRYVEGTCTETLWLINYETFPSSLSGLGARWPDRRIHVVSEFKPGSVPDDFTAEIQEVLTAHFAKGKHRNSLKAAANDEIAIILTWGPLPRDLDLHARLSRGPDHSHVSFENRGSLETAPFAFLCNDDRTGNGREVLRILRSELKSLLIAVHNFSGEIDLAGSGAVVKISSSEAADAVTIVAPTHGSGRWWHVVEYDAPTNTWKVINQINDTPSG